MNGEWLKLTVHFGEHDRVGRRLLSDVLLDELEQGGVRSAMLVRAAEGFGIKHRLHTQRLLTLSEDLPLVVEAVDRRAAIERLLPAVSSHVTGGLLTLERVAHDGEGLVPPAQDGGFWGREVKATLLLGRGERIEGVSGFRRAVDTLRSHGAVGSAVVLGVDGILRHRRGRARFLSSNADVPLSVTSIGSRASLGAGLDELCRTLGRPVLTLERVRVCKRDGIVLAAPPAHPGTDVAGLGVWQKLTVYTSETARHGRHPLYVELIHRLRLAGAAGATAIRGIWGHSGDHPPHGDRLLALGRRVPIVLTVVDRPEAAARWWSLIDELTEENGLVTAELVPAFQAVGPGISAGGLLLARPGPA